ncbi:MAG: thiamine phosphate synthase [Sulfurimonas sp.]|nr:thiamine phosphate synthase [Sulfurimonas sp.]
MQKYLITSREFYGDTLREFCSNLCKQLEKHQPEFVLYRDKNAQNYGEIATAFVTECKKFENVKSFLHQDSSLAKKLGASGVHLTSGQFDAIKEAKEMGLFVIISTHTHEEVLRAQMLGADAVTYSPIFVSPNKGEPKGIEDLRELLDICEIKVFALGGIVTQEHVEVIAQTKAYGFASIRYFY